MKVKVLKNISDRKDSYWAWLHWSGYALGFDEGYRRFVSEQKEINYHLIRRRWSYSDKDINWQKIYKSYKFKDTITIDCLPQDTIKKLLEKIERHCWNRLNPSRQPSGELCYPPFGIEPLSLEMRLEELGVSDNEIFIYSKHILNPGVIYRFAPGYDASKIFQSIILSPDDLHKTGNTILGVLLYTDEDIELAKYVREHFVSLDRLSGDWCKIYVLEKPPSDWKHIKSYWHAILKSELYEMWSLLRWIMTKPFEKSEAYKLARTIGVEPDQLPCLVLVGQNHKTPNLIFPIQQVSTDYMRRLFSLLERAVLQADSLKKNDPSLPTAFSAISDNFSQIIERLNIIAEKHETAYGAKYIFEGNTVFINRPRGDLNLSDFQK